MKKDYIITYVEKVYYKPVVIEAENEDQALELFNGCYLGDLDVIHTKKEKLEVKEA